GSKFAPHVPLPPVPTWKDVPQPTRGDYAMTDSVAHRAIHSLLWRRIVKLGLERAYRLDMGVVPWLVRNEIVGLACDEKILRDLSDQFGQEYRKTCEKIETLAGHPVNPAPRTGSR